MEYKDNDELTEEELMNVHNVRESYMDRPAEAEKLFGSRSKKELEAMKKLLEAGRTHKNPFNNGRRGR